MAAPHDMPLHCIRGHTFCPTPCPTLRPRGFGLEGVGWKKGQRIRREGNGQWRSERETRRDAKMNVLRGTREPRDIFRWNEPGGREEAGNRGD